MIRIVFMLSLSLVAWVLPGWAGSVEWIEVPASEAGQQWWDKGSVREDRQGLRSVLSRFTPAPTADGEQAPGELYVIQLDCAQQLYRDQQVNGIPRFRASWEAVGDDGLIGSVIAAVCDEPLPS